MNKIIDRYLFIISILLKLPNIQVLSQNQSSYRFIINKKEQQAKIALLTLVKEELHNGEYKVAFSAKGGSASGGNTYSLSSGVYFYQLKIRDPKTISEQAIIQTEKLFLLNNIFSIFI